MGCARADSSIHPMQIRCLHATRAIPAIGRLTAEYGGHASQTDSCALQIPTVVAEARKALIAGQAVVIGMQSTGQACSEMLSPCHINWSVTSAYRLVLGCGKDTAFQGICSCQSSPAWLAGPHLAFALPCASLQARLLMTGMSTCPGMLCPCHTNLPAIPRWILAVALPCASLQARLSITSMSTCPGVLCPCHTILSAHLHGASQLPHNVRACKPGC